MRDLKSIDESIKLQEKCPLFEPETSRTSFLVTELRSMHDELQTLRTRNAELEDLKIRYHDQARAMTVKCQFQQKRLTALESENEKLRRFREEAGVFVPAAISAIEAKIKAGYWQMGKEYLAAQAIEKDTDLEMFRALMASELWRVTE